MTSSPVLTRLLLMSCTLSVKRYCVQQFIPSDVGGWKNIGNVVIRQEGFVWVPAPEMKDSIPDLSIESREYYDRPVSERDVSFVSRFRTRYLVEALRAGQWADSNVVPPHLSGGDLAEEPRLFLDETDSRSTTESCD